MARLALRGSITYEMNRQLDDFRIARNRDKAWPQAAPLKAGIIERDDSWCTG